MVTSFPASFAARCGPVGRSDVCNIWIVALEGERLHFLPFCWNVDIRVGAGAAILDCKMEAMY